jgi:predicted  nucleic acid-binding Zn-ribbon protein
MAGILDRFRDYFSEREEAVKLEDAIEFYREENSDEIRRAERKAEELMQQTRELTEEFDESLEELKGYEHEKGIQAVEDVADNFYSSRKKMLERFENPEEIREHVKQFSEFVENVNDVSRKEGEVLKFIEKQSGDLPSAIQKLVDHGEKLEDFLEEDYSAVEAEEELEELLNDIKERKEETSRLKDEIDNFEIKELVEKKDELEQKIDEVEKSEEWTEKTEKEKRIEKLEEEKEEIMNQLSRQVSAVERPVKKLLYSVDNEDLEFKSDEEKLRKMLDRKFHEIEGLEKVLEEAVRKMEENDIADSDKRKKFLEAKTELSNLEEKKYNVDQKEEEIEHIREELEQLDVVERREDLEEEAGELRKKIEEKESEIEDKEREVDRIGGEVEDLENQVEEILNDNLGFEVNLNRS